MAVAVACAWLLGVEAVPRPWNGPSAWGAVAAGCAVVRAGAVGDRARTCAVWLLVGFASAALFVGLLGTGGGDDRVDALRDAGARVSAATVVERPGAVREDLSEDVVRGCTARLVVAVPGGPGRLAVKGAYTYDEPRAGGEVEVLWLRRRRSRAGTCTSAGI